MATSTETQPPISPPSVEGRSTFPESARSPWAGMAGLSEVSVGPVAGPVNGRMKVPGSKSMTNRALMLALAASRGGEGDSKLTNFLKSDDSYWAFDVLKRLGIEVETRDECAIIPSVSHFKSGDVFIGSAGTIARFLPGILAAQTSGEWTVYASGQLMTRPMGWLVDALVTLGADIEYLKEEGHYPLRIKGTGLTGGRVEISGKVSSQFISGLMIAAPLAQNPVEIVVTDPIVQQDYVKLTQTAMSDFGVGVEVSLDPAGHYETIRIVPQDYQPTAYEVEADASTASYFAALAAVTGGEIVLENLCESTFQPDYQFLSVLRKMGAEVTCVDGATTIKGPKDGKLKGGFEMDFKPMSDTALTLGAIAPFADGPITVRNVAHIRHHECDRIAALCGLMQFLGVKIEEYDDGFTIFPGAPQRGKTLETFDDHRVAMAFSLTGLAADGVTLKDPGCVSKTCPDYFQRLEALGVPVQQGVQSR